jgi:PKHD-type hydroxylase
MNAYWKMMSVDSTTVDTIKRFCEQLPVQESAIGVDGSTENNNYRRSKIRWVPKAGNEVSTNITNLLWNTAAEVNRNHFGLDINFLNDIQYATYYGSTFDKYDWDEDVFWANPTMNHRKISVIIQMSDPSEYEGGNVELDPTIVQPDPQALKQKGAMLIFPSFLRHRVTPVTSGVRSSLVSWIEGPKFR